MSDQGQFLRVLEAVLFAASGPLDEAALSRHLPEGADLDALLQRLAEQYGGKGVNLVRVAGAWALRTAPDLAPYLRTEVTVARKLSRAGVEALAVIAYHQPITRAEIEEIRGVSVSRGTIDTLLEAGWIRPGGRRQTPGRPLTWVTTGEFLNHFGLGSLDDLPGVEELKATGLLDRRPAITVVGGPTPSPRAEDREDSGDAEDEEPPFERLGE
ncbi:MAG: SMC-Scp complex subunit ScpB [Alphaproteobacteria bacterium]